MQAERAALLGVTVDVCVLPGGHVDLASIKFLPLLTGGAVIYAREHRADLLAEVTHNLVESSISAFAGSCGTLSQAPARIRLPRARPRVTAGLQMK